MKSKEEIEKLAFKSYGDTLLKGSFIHGYTQCQEDMAQFLKAEIHRAFIHGQGNAQMMEAGLERNEVEEYVNYRMLSLNKQD
jgi:hypothetical protein